MVEPYLPRFTPDSNGITARLSNLAVPRPTKLNKVWHKKPSALRYWVFLMVVVAVVVASVA